MRGLTVTADGPNALKLDWNKVTNDGGSAISGYLIQIADAETSAEPGSAADGWDDKDEVSVDANVTTLTYPTADVDDPLSAGDIRWFRVFAKNSVNTTSAGVTTITTDEISGAQARMGKTASAGRPTAPAGLTAEKSKTSNYFQTTEVGVLLLWNTTDSTKAQEDIDGYAIQYKSKADADSEWTAWTEVEDDTGDTDTFYTHQSEPTATEMRQYQVQAIGSGGLKSDWSNTAYYPLSHTADDAHVTASGSIAAQTVVSGESLDAMDVSGYFTGGDNVTYEADSSDDTIATATTDGSMVTIMGTAGVMATATATITVTATDDSGTEAMQPIAVTVNPANNAPVAMDIADVELAVGGSATVDLKESFSDADDGDTLTYAIAATRNAGGAISATIADGVVSITANKIGSAEIDVTGTDSSDASAMATIKVMVENQAPKAGEDIEAVTVKQNEKATRQSTIEDADAGDTLTWTVDDGDGTYATAEVDQMGMVTITGVKVTTDPVTITVTASDGMASDEQTFTVTVTQGALTAPTDVAAAVEGSSVTVTWTDGAFADVHHLRLISADFKTIIPVRVEGDPSPMTYTFEGVEPGVYAAAVRSTYGEAASKYAFTIVTVPTTPAQP